MAGVVGTSHTTLLAFLSSGCGTCADFWRAFGDGEGTRLPGRDTRLVIVTKSTQNESLSEVARLAPAGVTTLHVRRGLRRLPRPGQPLLHPRRRSDGPVVGEGAAASWAQVANLLGQAAADAGHDLDGLAAAAPGARGSHDRPRAAPDGPTRTCAPPASVPGTRVSIPTSSIADDDAAPQPDRPRSRRREEVTRAPSASRRRDARRRDRCHPVHVVALRRVDALEHHPAR